ncbi:MAG: tetratricopeptide repeat protein [Sorangiineae bacterium]|nr:tetratricopeptide repeat protein [Polyangiaceae bacterium]MEB2324023.1 tetratricopeptide repeat protein [Sorangiineae bacterium]
MDSAPEPAPRSSVAAEPEPLDARWGRWALAIVVVGVLAVYARSLGAPFVWDDRHLILEGSPVTEGRPLLSCFTEPFWTNAASESVRAYFRPLTTLSFVLDYRLHATNAAGYHLTNVIFHVLNAALLFALLRKWTAGTLAAALLALGWALHPRLTEAAGWISGRTDVLATSFVLLALLVFRPRSLARCSVAAALLFLGLLAKEVALAGMIAVLVWELGSEDGRLRPSRAALGHQSPVLVGLVAYVALRFYAMRGASAVSAPLSLRERALAILEAFGRSAWDLALPWPPRLQQGLLGAPDQRFVTLGALALLALLAGALVAHRRGGAVAGERRLLTRVSGVAGLTGIILVAHVIPISVNIVAADRFLYLPLAALTLMIAPAVERAARRRAGPTLLAGAVVVVALGAGTAERLNDWSSELRLWGKAYRATPKSNGLPANELGNLYFRAGLYPQALASYQSAARRANGRSTIFLSNAARALAQLGRYEAALPVLRKLCEEDRSSAWDCVGAAQLSLNALDLDAAGELLAEAERRRPGLAAAAELGQLLERVRRFARSPELRASDPAVRALARFRLAELAGRRLDALALAESLLARAELPAEERAALLEYFVRWAPPEELEPALGRFAKYGPLDAPLREAAQLRAAEGRALLEAWPGLGVGE